MGFSFHVDTLTVVHVVRYEGGDPMKVRVVQFNLVDIRSVNRDYNDGDSERLQRDSFVVRHIDLVRSRREMEDEYDHDAYCKHYEPFQAHIERPKSGKGTQPVKKTPTQNCSNTTAIQSKFQSLIISRPDAKDPKNKGSQSRAQMVRTRDWVRIEAPKKHSQEVLDGFEKLMEKEWNAYPLLLGKDKRKLLGKINETLPNLGRIYSIFVFLVEGQQIEIGFQGSGCIVSDDGRFVLTAGHIVETSFSRKEIIGKIREQFSNKKGYSRASRKKSAKIIGKRSINSVIYQTDSEKKLNRHTFYRCHRFIKDGKSTCKDEIEAEAFYVYPKWAEEMERRQERLEVSHGDLKSIFTTPANSWKFRFDFGILKLKDAPKKTKDLHEVAFGIISHVTEEEQMMQIVQKIKIGLWGYSADKDFTEEAKEDTILDHRASYEDVENFDESKAETKAMTGRSWGHSAPIFFDWKEMKEKEMEAMKEMKEMKEIEEMKGFKVLLSVTDSWHGVSGSPIWFIDNEEKSQDLEDAKMYLAPKTNRRIIGGVASCASHGHHLTEEYIENKKQSKKLSEQKIPVTLDQSAVFDDDVLDWIEQVTKQKCHRAKYDVTGETKWETGEFYLNGKPVKGKAKKSGNEKAKKSGKGKAKK